MTGSLPSIPRAFSYAPLLFSWFVSASLISPEVIFAATFSGTVVRVVDGDTLDVRHNGQKERIRVNGIDCPEHGQRFGEKATEFTERMVLGKEVSVQDHGRDRHNRIIGDVSLPDGADLSHELVRAGLAWWYRQYSKDETLGNLEAEAREAQRGLWADANPTPPWEIRHPATRGGSGSVRKSQDGTSENQDQSNLIIGNRRSHIYHRSDCPNYTSTSQQNRIMFQSSEEAEAAGYRLAKDCPSRP